MSILLVYIYNTNYTLLTVIENYFSLIWTERYFEAGEFELEVPLIDNNISALVVGNYVVFDQSESPMIIERVDIVNDIEDGIYIRVSGRSIASLLERRVLWRTEFANDVRIESLIYQILDDNVKKPNDILRRLPITFERYTLPSNQKISAQFTEYNVYELVQSLCMAYNIGFKVLWPAIPNGSLFRFSLYEGTDRSANQNKTTPIIFSSEFDNLISAKYKSTTKGYCNTALVLGEEQGTDRRRTVINAENEGLNRYELLVDARDIQSEFEEGAEVEEGELEPDETYIPRLEERGIEKLAETSYTGEYSTEVEPNGIFKYGEHYFLGDIVTVDTGLGIVSQARVSEYIYSIEANDFKAYPTLMLI